MQQEQQQAVNNPRKEMTQQEIQIAVQKEINRTFTQQDVKRMAAHSDLLNADMAAGALKSVCGPINIDYIGVEGPSLRETVVNGAILRRKAELLSERENEFNEELGEMQKQKDQVLAEVQAKIAAIKQTERDIAKKNEDISAAESQITETNQAIEGEKLRISNLRSLSKRHLTEPQINNQNGRTVTIQSIKGILGLGNSRTLVIPKDGDDNESKPTVIEFIKKVISAPTSKPEESSSTTPEFMEYVFGDITFSTDRESKKNLEKIITYLLNNCTPDAKAVLGLDNNSDEKDISFIVSEIIQAAKNAGTFDTVIKDTISRLGQFVDFKNLPEDQNINNFVVALRKIGEMKDFLSIATGDHNTFIETLIASTDRTLEDYKKYIDTMFPAYSYSFETILQSVAFIKQKQSEIISKKVLITSLNQEIKLLERDKEVLTQQKTDTEEKVSQIDDIISKFNEDKVSFLEEGIDNDPILKALKEAKNDTSVRVPLDSEHLASAWITALVLSQRPQTQDFTPTQTLDEQVIALANSLSYNLSTGKLKEYSENDPIIIAINRALKSSTEGIMIPVREGYASKPISEQSKVLLLRALMELMTFRAVGLNSGLTQGDVNEHFPKALDEIFLIEGALEPTSTIDRVQRRLRLIYELRLLQRIEVSTPSQSRQLAYLSSVFEQDASRVAGLPDHQKKLLAGTNLLFVILSLHERGLLVNEIAESIDELLRANEPPKDFTGLSKAFADKHSMSLLFLLTALSPSLNLSNRFGSFLIKDIALFQNVLTLLEVLDKLDDKKFIQEFLFADRDREQEQNILTQILNRIFKSPQRDDNTEAFRDQSHPEGSLLTELKKLLNI